MNRITDYPLLVLAVAFFALWLSARIGSSILKKQRKLDEDIREDFGVIQNATLTLLGLIIGFTFSMAIGRYEERKNYEEARPTRSAQNTSGLICCLATSRQECVRCS